MSLKRINHGNENHTPGFIEDTGDSMTGDLTFANTKGLKGEVLLITLTNYMFISSLGLGNLAIGVAGGGSTTEVQLSSTGVIFPIQAPTVSAPTYVEGGLYYDTTLHKLMIGGAAGWETVTSS